MNDETTATPMDPLAPDEFVAWYRDVPPAPPGARERLRRHLELDAAERAQRTAIGAPPGARAHRRVWARGGIAAAAVLVLFLLASRPPAARSPVPGDAASPVRIELHAPSARQVALVGDFNAWSRETDRMAHDPEAGVWHAEVALPPGRHGYAFIVDGERWTIDPRAPQADLSDFGAINVVLVASR